MKKYHFAIFGILAVYLLAVSLPARAAADDETIMEALGAALGLSLYNSQVIIGMTADAYSSKVYENEQSKTILSEQKSSIGLLKDYVGKIKKLPGTSKSDITTLGEISACIDKIDATIDSLTGYIDDPSQDKADLFEKNRAASYGAIADLLGIKQE
jgi:hypothetical protein